jgi:hypothetical protein
MAISSVKAIDAGNSPDSSAQIAALQRQLAAAQKELLAVQKGAPDKASEQQQKMISQRIVTFQAQIAQLQASGGQKGSEPTVEAAAGTQTRSDTQNELKNAISEDTRSEQQERPRSVDGALGSIIDTQA